jgi:hypothetical protein
MRWEQVSISSNGLPAPVAVVGGAYPDNNAGNGVGNLLGFVGYSNGHLPFLPFCLQ